MDPPQAMWGAQAVGMMSVNIAVQGIGHSECTRRPQGPLRTGKAVRKSPDQGRRPMDHCGDFGCYSQWNESHLGMFTEEGYNLISKRSPSLL